MPPKSAEPVKKKAEPPQELCGCGVNTFRAPPKGKKKPPVMITHNADCTFQRAPCNRYPHLPKCAVCEVGCPVCLQVNPWCPLCSENKCRFMFQRDVLGWSLPRPPAMPPMAAPASSGGAAAGAGASASGSARRAK